MKNVHMYDYLLAIKDETHIYKAIIEAVPDENDSMMIWLDDFNFPQAEIEDIKKEIELYFKARNITCIFGKPVKEHRRSDPDTAVGKSLRFFRRF